MSRDQINLKFGELAKNKRETNSFSPIKKNTNFTISKSKQGSVQVTINIELFRCAGDS